MVEEEDPAEVARKQSESSKNDCRWTARPRTVLMHADPGSSDATLAELANLIHMEEVKLRKQN